MQRYVFIDTMVFLHFRPLDELNLPEIVGAGSFAIVLPRITISELDKHKSTHPHRRIRNRAQRVLSEIEDAVENGRLLKGGIPVEYFPEFPEHQLREMKLDPTSGDDILIASSVAYRDASPNRHILIISQDTTVRMTCRHHQIDVRQLSPEHQLRDEPDDEEKELLELRRESQLQKSARPRLDLGFPSASGITKHQRFRIMAAKAIDEQFLANAISELRKSLPKMPMPAKRDSMFGDVDLYIERMGFNPITPERISKYNSGLERYFKQIEEYFLAEHANHNRLRLSFPFQLEIHNTGVKPAEDVDLILTFQSGILIKLEKPTVEEPTRPSPPEPPSAGFTFPSSSIDDMLARDSLIAVAGIKDRNSSFGPDLKRTKEGLFVLRQHFNRVKHGLPVPVSKLYVDFRTENQIQPFECSYELLSANIAEPVTGSLQFVVENVSYNK